MHLDAARTTAATQAHDVIRRQPRIEAIVSRLGRRASAASPNGSVISVIMNSASISLTPLPLLPRRHDAQVVAVPLP